MAIVRAFVGQCVGILLGPPEAVAEDSEQLLELQKDLATSVAWSFQALLAAAAFCAVTAASHGDWNLLTQATSAAATAAAAGVTEVPLIGVKLAFLPFLVIGSLALLAMQIYLQIQAHALLLMPRANENSLIRNHDRWWPISLLGVASYAVVPLVTLFLLWKIWPRAFQNEPALLGIFEIPSGRAAIGFCLAISCLFAIRGALSDRRCLQLVKGHAARTRMNAKVATAIALVVVFAGIWIGSAFQGRHLELLKAPLDGADLRLFDLSGADLSEARLNGALMGGARLLGAKLAGADLDNADLRGAELSGADLSAARLNYADLTGAWMVGANLRRVEAEGAHFDHAWMVGTIFEPVPATIADRSKPPAKADLTYAEADTIQTMSITGARMCGSMITPGHWKEKSVIIGEIAVANTPDDKPFCDAKRCPLIPKPFQPRPMDEGDKRKQGGQDGYLGDALTNCLKKLNICTENPRVPQCTRDQG